MTKELFNTWESFATDEEFERTRFGKSCAYIEINYAKIAKDDKNVSLSNKLSRLLTQYKDDEMKFNELSDIAMDFHVGGQVYKAKKGFCELYQAKIIDIQSERKHNKFGESNYRED